MQHDFYRDTHQATINQHGGKVEEPAGLLELITKNYREYLLTAAIAVAFAYCFFKLFSTRKRGPLRCHHMQAAIDAELQNRLLDFSTDDDDDDDDDDDNDDDENENAADDDEKQQQSADNDSEHDSDNSSYYSDGLVSAIKSVQIKKMVSELTPDQLEEEKRVEREQMAAIYELLKKQEAQLNVTELSEGELTQQLRLYR